MIGRERRAVPEDQFHERVILAHREGSGRRA